MAESCDLDNVVFYPQYPEADLPGKVANFLSAEGLIETEFFSIKIDASRERIPRDLGPWMESSGDACPVERRHWPVIGWLRFSELALDPVSGEVHGYAEGEDGSVILHSGVQSLAFAVLEFRKISPLLREASMEDRSELVDGFRRRVSAVDSYPFQNEASEWVLMLDEIEEGM